MQDTSLCSTFVWNLDMDYELDISEAKKEINNILFMMLPDDTTITELETLAIAMLEPLVNFDEARQNFQKAPYIESSR